MKVYVYVDGFNLYYRALKGTPYKWINLVELAQRVLGATDEVTCVRYFTARVSSRAGDIDAPKRQQILLSALNTIPNLKTHYGKFLSKNKRRPTVEPPHAFVEIMDTEEKGSDVNLAVHLLNDGWQKRYDGALVMSQDSDLLEPMRIVTQQLNLPVGVAWLDGKQPAKAFKNAASFIRHIKRSDLAASQLPDPVIRNDGKQIFKPTGW